MAGSFPVLIPPTPGVLSALGFLQADVRNEFSKTYIRTISQLDRESVVHELHELGEEANNWLKEESVPEERRRISYEVDVRYFRQGFEIPIAVTLEDLQLEGLALLKRRFDSVHERTYGFKMDVDLEIVNVRAVAVGRVVTPNLPVQERAGADPAQALIDPDHKAYFDGEFITTPLFDRTLLRPGNQVFGPAIITQKDSTTLVLPGFVAEVDVYTNLIITATR